MTHTERSMIEHLYKRYSYMAGNGARYAVATHVRSAAGFDGTRTCDFMAMDLWPSKGLQLIGHEIKVSRSDWLCELRQPEKAAEFMQFCNRWFLVVPDPGIVKRSELPDGWGVLALRERRWGDHMEPYLHEVHRAPRLDPKPMPRTMTCALLRAVEKTAVRRTRSALLSGDRCDAVTGYHATPHVGCILR